MAAIETTVRDAIVTALGGETFSSALAVAGQYDVVKASEAKDTAAKLYVYPGPRRTVRQSREVIAYRLTFYVVLMKKMPTAGRGAAVDEMISLANEVEEWFTASATMGGADFEEFQDGETGRDPYDLDALSDHNFFQATLLPTFIYLP